MGDLLMSSSCNTLEPVLDPFEEDGFEILSEPPPNLAQDMRNTFRTRNAFVSLENELSGPVIARIISGPLSMISSLEPRFSFRHFDIHLSISYLSMIM
jgi:hypothetical protein